MIDKKFFQKVEKFFIELKGVHQGEIQYPEDYKGPGSFLVVDNKHFCYPKFIGQVSNNKFVVEISNFPCGSLGLKKSLFSNIFLTIDIVKT